MVHFLCFVEKRDEKFERWAQLSLPISQSPSSSPSWTSRRLYRVTKKERLVQRTKKFCARTILHGSFVEGNRKMPSVGERVHFSPFDTGHFLVIAADPSVGQIRRRVYKWFDVHVCVLLCVFCSFGSRFPYHHFFVTRTHVRLYPQGCPEAPEILGDDCRCHCRPKEALWIVCSGYYQVHHWELPGQRWCCSYPGEWGNRSPWHELGGSQTRERFLCRVLFFFFFFLVSLRVRKSERIFCVLELLL